MQEIKELRALISEYSRKRQKYSEKPLTAKRRLEMDAIYTEIIRKIEDIGYIDSRQNLNC